MRNLFFILFFPTLMFAIVDSTKHALPLDTLIDYSPALRNGGFELDPDENGDHFPWGGFGGAVLTDTTEVHSGSHAQAFWKYGQTMMGQNNSPAFLKPLRFYGCSFWAKRINTGDPTDTTAIRVAMGDQAVGIGEGDDTTVAQTGTWSNVAGFTFTGFKIAVVDTGWTYFEYPIVQASDYTYGAPYYEVAFQFILRADTKGVIIDDVRLWEVNPHIYYVDATLGNDSASGVTPTMAWKTLNKISETTFSAGDTILFKRGETFQGEITKSGTGFVGTADSNICIGAYGTGAAPIFYGDFTGSTLNDTTVANADTTYFYYTTNDTVNIYGINDTIHVLLSDTAGVPISGVAVTFARTTAPTGAIGQAITTTQDTTNESGLAITILTLGSKAGNYVVTATSTGLGGSPVTITTNAYRSSNRLIKR